MRFKTVRGASGGDRKYLSSHTLDLCFTHLVYTYILWNGLLCYLHTADDHWRPLRESDDGNIKQHQVTY